MSEKHKKIALHSNDMSGRADSNYIDQECLDGIGYFLLRRLCRTKSFQDADLNVCKSKSAIKYKYSLVLFSFSTPRDVQYYINAQYIAHDACVLCH